MEFTFDTNNWVARFYRRAYGDYSMPDDFCPFAKKVIWAFLILPFTWIGYFLVTQKESLGSKFVFTNVVQGLWLASGKIAQLELVKAGHTGGGWTLMSYLLIPIIVYLAIASFMGIVILVITTYEKFVEPRLENRRYQKRFRSEAKTDGFIKFYYKSFKNKYCPKINWIDGKEKEKPLSETA